MASRTLVSNQRVNKLVLGPLACWGIVIVPLYVAGFWNQSNTNESVSVTVTALFFFLPMALQAVAWFFLWSRVNRYYYFFNLTVTTICLGACYGFWLCYFNRTKYLGEYLQILSYFSLIIIAVVLAAVGVMTYAIMRPSPDHVGGEFCTQLNEGVRSHPFWAISFFFTLFIGVAYLFGFSLAFHDKHAIRQTDQAANPNRQSKAAISEEDLNRELRPALMMDNQKSIDDWVAKAEPKASPSTENLLPGFQQYEYNFYFKSNEAHFRTEVTNACDEQSPTKRSWMRDPSIVSGNEESNYCHLQAIVKRIKKEVDNGQRIKITLIGHSDNEPVGPGSRLRANTFNIPNAKTRGGVSNSTPVFRYVSNFELSSARADDVKYQVLQMFPDKERLRNIEWLIRSASNEDVYEISAGLINQDVFEKEELRSHFTQDQIANRIDSKDLAEKFGENGFAKMYSKMGPERSAEENRVVLVSIEPIVDFGEVMALGLVDYLYFSIYTITTTGYGDIKPTTSYAKFVTSIANFCEVLFLVVFFNALVSLRPKPDDDDTSRARPSRPDIPCEPDVVDAGAVGPRAVVRALSKD